MLVYQLGKIRKYISTHTASLIYFKLYYRYSDFMIESHLLTRYKRLEWLQEKALKCMDN